MSRELLPTYERSTTGLATIVISKNGVSVATCVQQGKGLRSHGKTTQYISRIALVRVAVDIWSSYRDKKWKQIPEDFNGLFFQVARNSTNSEPAGSQSSGSVYRKRGF